MFPCTKCGACCRRAKIVIDELAKNGIEFPYKARANGECEMLEDNKCKVYENRPDVCKLDVMAKILHMKKETYYKLTAIECNKMMDEDNIPIEFRVII